MVCINTVLCCRLCRDSDDRAAGGQTKGQLGGSGHLNVETRG